MSDYGRFFCRVSQFFIFYRWTVARKENQRSPGGKNAVRRRFAIFQTGPSGPSGQKSNHILGGNSAWLRCRPWRASAPAQRNGPRQTPWVIWGQPACVLRLPLRKFRSVLWSVFWQDTPLGKMGDQGSDFWVAHTFYIFKSRSPKRGWKLRKIVI